MIDQLDWEPPEPSVDAPVDTAAPTWEPPEPIDASSVVVGEVVVFEEPRPSPRSQEEEIADRASQIVRDANALQVQDKASFERADAMLDMLKEQKRRIEAFFEDDIKRAYATWNGLTSKRKAYTDPLDSAIKVVSERWYTFKKAEERKAAEERAAIERELQARERERLQKEADERAAEAKRLEEEALAATSRDAALELEAQAQETQAQAEQLTVAAASVQAPVIQHASANLPDQTKNSGREKWNFRVLDKVALIKAVAAGKVSHEALIPHDVYLRSRAKADKDTVQIPGVQFYDEGSVARGRKR